MAGPERRPWRLDELTWVVDRPERNGAFSTFLIAGPGPRFLAGLLDLALQLALLAAAAAGFWLLRPGQAQTGLSWARTSPWNVLLLLMVLTVLHVLWTVLMELLTSGRTPGKMLCRLRAVAQTGSDCTARQLIVRNLLRMADLLPAWYLLGGAVMVSTDYRQRLGDLAARTVVIHDPPLRDLLAASGTPPSAYSTSEDGYLLEAALRRETLLLPDASAALESRLAVWLFRTYRPGDPFLRDLYLEGNHAAYLRALYRQELADEAGDAVPSGLPQPPSEASD